MENKSKKSKAFIITFIAGLFLLLVGYLIFTNANKIFRLGTDNGGGKTFNPLPSDLGNLTLIEYPDSFLKSFPTKRMIAQAGEDLKKGDVVYIDSIGNDGIPIVKKALASDPAKSVIFGVVTEDIIAGTNGEITTSGPVVDLNTNKNEGTPWSTNDQLYLSLTTPGEMTKNIPNNPNQVFYVGVVVKVGTNDGIINVGGKGTTTSAWVDFAGTVFKNNINARMAEAGENLMRGDVVYISGFNASGVPIVKKAIAGDPIKGIVYGVAGNSANTGGLVEIIVGGAISGIQANQNDTNPWKVGDQLYLSGSTAGIMTNQLSSSSSTGVLVGVVMRIAGGTYTVNIGGSGTTISSWNSFSANSQGIMVSGGGSGSAGGQGEFGSGSTSNQGSFGSFFGSMGDTLNSAWSLITMTIGSWADSIFGTGTFGGGTFGGGTFGGGDNACWNGADNYPKCNVKDNKCLNGATNPPDCNIGSDGTPGDGTPGDGTPGDGTPGDGTPGGSLPNPGEEETPTPSIPQCRDGIDNDGDGFVDAQDPGCHVDDDLSKAYRPEKNFEENVVTEKKDEINQCLVMYENPLIFTVDEQAELDELLRKFYLIAPTLKNEEDIFSAYDTFDRYQELIENTTLLTKQCYEQTNNLPDYQIFCNNNKEFCSWGKDAFGETYLITASLNNKYTGPKTIYGNPWFNYSDRGDVTVWSYVYTGAIDCGPIPCSSFPIRTVNDRYTKSPISDNGPYLYLPDFETILNIW